MQMFRQISRGIRLLHVLLHQLSEIRDCTDGNQRRVGIRQEPARDPQSRPAARVLSSKTRSENLEISLASSLFCEFLKPGLKMLFLAKI